MGSHCLLLGMRKKISKYVERDGTRWVYLYSVIVPKQRNVSKNEKVID